MTPDEETAVAERIRARQARERAERDAKWAATSDEDLLRMRIQESRGGLDLITSACLGVAVPMWIDRMRFWLPRERQQRAHALVEIIAHHQAIAAICDTEARGTARRGDLGVAFNAIAEGLACLAYCPGGVVFAGHHWEAT